MSPVRDRRLAHAEAGPSLSSELEDGAVTPPPARGLPLPIGDLDRDERHRRLQLGDRYLMKLPISDDPARGCDPVDDALEGPLALRRRAVLEQEAMAQAVGKLIREQLCHA